MRVFEDAQVRCVPDPEDGLELLVRPGLRLSQQGETTRRATGSASSTSSVRRARRRSSAALPARSACARASSSSRPRPARSVTRLGYAILVSDLDRSVAFYRDLLGLPFKFARELRAEFATEAPSSRCTRGRISELLGRDALPGAPRGRTVRLRSSATTSTESTAASSRPASPCSRRPPSTLGRANTARRGSGRLRGRVDEAKGIVRGRPFRPHDIGIVSFARRRSDGRPRPS